MQPHLPKKGKRKGTLAGVPIRCSTCAPKQI
nr:MAG TPA: hypothetical protein [Caudoviricetes sp.]